MEFITKGKDGYDAFLEGRVIKVHQSKGAGRGSKVHQSNKARAEKEHGQGEERASARE